jgi:CxxC motif-containing protein
MESEITCIICPIGCEMTVYHKEGIITDIKDYECKKGIEYAKEELLDPKRTLTTTIAVTGGELPLVSVKTQYPIPKEKLFDAMDEISEIVVEAPVNIHDTILDNILNLDIDIVATKNVRKKK